jgi:tetratricopeptide (TPR) repeat protein
LWELLNGSPDGPARPVVISAIDGMGGVGKSALAIHLAYQLVEARLFPDGQLYVNLQGAAAGLPPLAPLEALGRMLRSLGTDPAAIPAEVEEAAARFRSLAAQRRLLVLLDNASSMEQVRPLLPASPTCAVLVTSRRVLGTLEGVRTLHLDVLTEEEALELLCRIAGRERIAAEARAAAEVVRWCGRLPLAIRIAGARLVARPRWPIRELAEHLADSTQRLEALQAGELAVQASFDVSLQALRESRDAVDRTAATAFGLLSLPDGPDICIPAAARLIDRPQSTAQAVLERLVDVQLIETPRPGRYQFHDLMRVYAREYAAHCYPEPERLAALTRLIGFYTATAWRTLALLFPGTLRLATADPRWSSGGFEFADASAALDWSEAERSNLLAAITQGAHAVASGASAVPAELPGQLTLALIGFFDVRCYSHDWVQANKAVLELAHSTGDRVSQAYASLDLGIAQSWLGRYEEAIPYLREAIRIFRELGDRRGEGIGLFNLASCGYFQLSRYAEAMACLQEARPVLRELDDRQAQASCERVVGIIYGRMGRHEEAIVCLHQGLTVYGELSDRRGRAMSLNSLGVVYGRVGRHGEAINCLQEGLTIFRELGDPRGEANCLNDLGVVYGQMERHRKAIALLQKALYIHRELGGPCRELFTVLRDLGEALHVVGRDREAGVAWHDALAICKALRIPDADEIRGRLATLPSDSGEVG